MTQSEFIQQMGFAPEFSDILSTHWDEVSIEDTMPECFTDGYFDRYAAKLGVPTPFAPEIPELNARVAAENSLRIYANLICAVAWSDNGNKLALWPAPEKLLTKRQCGLFNLVLALSILPRIAESYRELGLPPEFADAPAKWIGGTIAIYAAAHDGNPGHDLRQIHWLKHYQEKRLFRVGRFEFLTHCVPDWVPAIYRSRKTRRTVALCLEGWELTPEGFRAPYVPPKGKTPVYQVAHLDEVEGKITGIPINPATGRAEVKKRETLDLAEYAPVLTPHEWVPSLHIPGGGGMTVELAKESLQQAVEFFRKYFRKELRAVCCYSWILNPAWLTELPESNLTGFMKELYLTPMPEQDREGLFFVYGREDGELSNYPADTSLHRAFHQIIEAEQPLRAGGMFLLIADLDRFGTGTYR